MALGGHSVDGAGGIGEGLGGEDFGKGVLRDESPPRPASTFTTCGTCAFDMDCCRTAPGNKLIVSIILESRIAL